MVEFKLRQVDQTKKENCVNSAAAQAVLALLSTSSGVQRGKLL